MRTDPAFPAFTVKNISNSDVNLLGKVKIRPGEIADLYDRLEYKEYGSLTNAILRELEAPAGEIYLLWKAHKKIEVIDFVNPSYQGDGLVASAIQTANSYFEGAILGFEDGGLKWLAGGAATGVSVVTANGLSGTVADPTTTPAITLSTTVTGLLKGNGTAISAAVAGTDYAPAGNYVTTDTVQTITATKTMSVNSVLAGLTVTQAGAGQSIDVTAGQVAIPDGTAVAPAIAFRDDLSTGIFSPSNDIFGISVNGSEAVRIQESASTPVVLVGTSTAHGAITVDSSSADGTAGVVMLGHANNGTALQESYRGGQFAGVRSRGTKASPTGVQAGDGLVNMLGAGVMSDGYINYGSLITMKAEETFTSTASGGRIEFHTTPSGTSGAATLGGATTERMRITDAGFVGIGTSSPTAILTVGGSIAVGEGSAPTSTPAFGKLWADGYSDARPYWTDDTGQDYNLTLDRFNTLDPGASVVIDVDPALPIFNSLAIDQDTTFTTSNLGSGRSASVRVICDDTGRNLHFPAGWTWLGSGPPTAILANDVGYLSIVAYGANNSDVVAAWSHENAPTGVTGSGTDNQIAVWSGTDSQDGSASLTFDGSSLVVDAAAVFNESGAAVDFRIESDANANMFFVDGTNNRVGIGTPAPSSIFAVGSTSQFRVGSAGDLERIRDVAYSFPASQGAAGTVLTNDGYGALSWAASTAGATSAPISTKTSSYVMTTADGTILADATSGAITITLPAAASAAETIFTIKKKDITFNIVTVDANGAELIDGSTTYDLRTQYEAIKVQSDGSAWWII
jgi:hypothetical protein